MLKAVRPWSVIAVFFFVVSMGSCGGGGGDNAGNNATPSPGATQVSNTDSSGLTSFSSSQGKTLTVEVKDGTTQVDLPNMSVAFSEIRNNEFIIVVSDPAANYASAIFAGTITSSAAINKSRSSVLRNSGSISDFIIPLLPFVGLKNYFSSIFNGGTPEAQFIETYGDLYNAGTLQWSKCMTVSEYIETKKSSLDLQPGNTILVLSDLVLLGAPVSTPAKIALKLSKGLFTHPLSDIEASTLEYLYEAKKIDSYDKNQIISVDYYTVDSQTSLSTVAGAFIVPRHADSSCAASPPSITGISPNPVTGSDSQQTITLTGSNFQSGLTVTVGWTGGSKTLDTSQVAFDSSTQVRIFITTSTSPDNWWVKVTNSDGQPSNTMNFSVIAPAPTPTYTISGRVTSNGTGLSGVSMTLTGSGSTSTSTDSNGNYSFSGAQNGAYTITPSLTGYSFNPQSLSVTVNNADVTGQDFIGTSTPVFNPNDVVGNWNVLSNSYEVGVATWQTVSLKSDGAFVAKKPVVSTLPNSYELDSGYYQMNGNSMQVYFNKITVCGGGTCLDQAIPVYLYGTFTVSITGSSMKWDYTPCCGTITFSKQGGWQQI